ALDTARRAFAVTADLFRQEGNSKDLPTALRNQLDVELLAGRLPMAREMAVQALSTAHTSGDPDQRIRSNVYLAAVLAKLGEVFAARRHFGETTDRTGHSLYGIGIVWEAELLWATGNRIGARDMDP